MKRLKHNIGNENTLIMIVIFLIVLFIGIECYSVTHIELKTQTAVVSTVYDNVETQALFVRQEKVIKNADSGITVACLDDGEKINVGGNVGMKFDSKDSATAYSKYNEYEKQLNYYETLENQTIGQSGNLENINQEIENAVIDYALSLENGVVESTSQDLNAMLIRRQIIIGEDVDLISRIQDLRSKMDKYAANAKPDDYISTKTSGVFSTYTDGLEKSLDIDNIEETTPKEFKAAVKKVSKAYDASSDLGKLVTSYVWYIEALVDTDVVQYIENGDTIEIALKDDNNSVLKVQVVNGAEPALGEKQTLLILKCNKMNENLAKLRYNEIEIRRKSYEGIKVPTEALHVVDGKKGVYVLIASQVRFREVSVIYSDDDYVLCEYDSSNSDSIHLYDKIITQGKDLQDGKVYT